MLNRAVRKKKKANALNLDTMFLCNASAIKDWSFFLSHILPLVNKTADLVRQSDEKVEATTSALVTVLEPELGGASASRAPSNANHTSGLEHVLQYSYSENELPHTEHKDEARDAIPLPKAVLYLVMAALVVVAVAYAIRVTVLFSVTHSNLV
ncbi:hypothetical protein Z043_104806 [Scleropages formosus]|uniref:Uncharacterized protein n=1 Tax=Scleropages formosus TaxID=113540 RepID=A0A0P7V047_SCLFO|nr:hypothetical protein Z043_104806 [Scleropages formosus]